MKILLTLLASCVLASAAPFGFNANQMVARTNLVGHWLYGPNQSGASVADWSGFGNAGTTTNSPVWTNGVSANLNALNFNGVNNGVNCGSSVNCQPTNSCTISAWVYHRSFASGPVIVTDCSWNDGLNGYIFDFDNMTGKLKLILGNATTIQVILSPFQPQTNAWQHLAATWNGASVVLYVNGISVTNVTQTISPLNGARPTFIGIDAATTTFGQMSGIINDVRLYNTNLTATAIASMSYTTNGVTYPVPGR